MDLLVNHYQALTLLFLGALGIIVSVYAFVKPDFVIGWLMGIFSASFIAQGLLDLTRLTVPGWVLPSIEAVCAIVVIWIGISARYTALS